MKALIYRTFGPPDVLEWADWPEPVAGPGQVKVRVVAGGLNPKDILLRKGKFQGWLARRPLPRASGLDLAGEVVETGGGVEDFKPGDRVFGMTNDFCGGVHAEYACLPADEVAPVPEGMPWDQAAALPLAGQTALQAIRDLIRPEASQHLLVNGASGGVGHFAVQIAHCLGLEVTATGSASNHDWLRELGADEALDYRETPPDRLKTRFDGIFDVFGNYSRRALSRQLRSRGVYVSTIPRPGTIVPEALARLTRLGHSRLVLVHSNRADLEQLADWYRQGRLRAHIDSSFPIQQAVEAHRRVETRHARGKVVLQIAESD